MSWQPVHLNLRNWLIGFDFQSFRKGKDYKPIESIICHQLRSGSFIKPDMFIKKPFSSLCVEANLGASVCLSYCKNLQIYSKYMWHIFAFSIYENANWF